MFTYGQLTPYLAVLKLICCKKAANMEYTYLRKWSEYISFNNDNRRNQFFCVPYQVFLLVHTILVVLDCYWPILL